MSDKDFQKLLEENKDNLREMFEFWRFFQSLNKFLKWVAIIFFPLVLGGWGVLKIIKKH